MSTNAPRVLLRSEDSGGEVAVIEVGGGARPPLHHHDFDEAFYVLEGELTFRLRDELFTRKAGELTFAPRGVPHTYANLSGASARALTVCTPAGFERYFDRIAARIAGVEPPPEASKPIPEVTTVGPAIGDATTREEKQKMGLGTYKVRASVAVSDMAMAADFYEGKLGLEARESQADESRVYECGGDTSLHVYESPAHAGKATATLATW
jgi:quercetin dioxygenase-like cupin family protein